MGGMTSSRPVGGLASTLIALAAAPGVLAQDAARNSGGLGGGGPAVEAGECVPGWQRRQIEVEIAAHSLLYGPYTPPEGPAAYTFYPQGCNLHGDSLIGNYVDLDAAAGFIQSYDCGVVTYDGHKGIDSLLRSFSEQAVGVPIFAALDGVVIARDDGHPDMNTSCAGNPPANYVVLDHGGGRHTWYLHMRNGSVAVSLNETVRAGQQLGLAASSGCSTWPHLHFETRQNNVALEPFAGPCRPGASGWASQADRPAAPYIAEWGVTTTNLSTVPLLPFRPPTQGAFALSDPVATYYWAEVGSLPGNSTWQFVFVRPNGTVSFQTPVGNFSTVVAKGLTWWWWQWTVPEMRQIAGTWRVRMLINGEQVIDAPVLVSAMATGLNRPPEPITAALDPMIPEAGGAVFCRVGTMLAVDDLDGDLVRYTYEWERNGAAIRSITSAGHADAIPAGLSIARDILRCTVTPGDGQVSGPPVTVAVDVGCYANCDASSAAPRLNVGDFTCFLQRFAGGDAYANCDGSTAAPALNVADFTCFLQRFAAGCP